MANTYVQGLGLDSKWTRVAAAGGRRHWVGNQVGTVESVLDDAAGVVERVLRDAWGQQIGGSSQERFGFAQREHDSESGLVHMRHRMYDPRSGRFTQTDPIRGNRPFEHYAYAMNDPVGKTDPLGLITESERNSYLRLVTSYLKTYASAKEAGNKEKVAASLRQIQETRYLLRLEFELDRARLANDPSSVEAYESLISTKRNDAAAIGVDLGRLKGNATEELVRDLQVQNNTMSVALGLQGVETDAAWIVITLPIDALFARLGAGQVGKGLFGAADDAVREVQKVTKLRSRLARDGGAVLLGGSPASGLRRGDALSRALERARRAREALDERHVRAYVLEKAGGSIPKPGGGVWDHVTEVENAIRSQKHAIEELKQALGEATDAPTKEWLRKELSDISELIDAVEKAVKR